MPQQWQLVPGQSLLHRSWDGQVVLYNEVSGATHLLDEQTLGLLQALRDGELGPDEWHDAELQLACADLGKLYLVEPC
ncbi:MULTISPECIES: HPr-rel-A system PqqD family peptide chaperone [unclassified Duganella]|uniref:HPr-rel-A system PqqD family peptide chaperone n=1 Tax=unclassified Duganella TaxID=2636909 RepID=UPI0006FF1E91|nr:MULTISPECIES: HPr-rel-A system PqqD family peptide chaperone [unclassified Duganella]KQV59017.1 hypothetical protein ASD07_25585 [Duganella sp. Root336D2]KRC02487.1 hypothetical protein ASE26_18390 [Duganella sp. Root198D2]